MNCRVPFPPTWLDFPGKGAPQSATLLVAVCGFASNMSVAFCSAGNMKLCVVVAISLVNLDVLLRLSLYTFG